MTAWEGIRTPGNSGSLDAGADVARYTVGQGMDGDAQCQMTGWVKSQARELGFDLVGVAPAARSTYEQYVRQWIVSGQAGTMDWLVRYVEALVDVHVLMPEAQSIICVAANYHFPLEPAPASSSAGRIAGYALGDDYHDVIRSRLHKLADEMRVRWPGTHTKCSVDVTPILEREYAMRAGIGWVGKNTCVINPRMGSWLLLGEVITNAKLVPDEAATDHCGTCRRCIDACPTGAIVAPYQMDARKCISYLNIEHRGQLSEQQQKDLGQWLVGCDICQDVCPFNQRSPEATLRELRPRLADGHVDLKGVIGWSEEDYRREFRRSAVRRVKLPVLQANARSILCNREMPSPTRL